MHVFIALEFCPMLGTRSSTVVLDTFRVLAMSSFVKYGGSQFQNPEVFPSHKTMFSPFYIYAYDLENFFYF